MMVASIAVGLDSSDDECIAVKRWSAGRKFVLSDDEAAEDSNSNLKVSKPLGSDGEPDTETPEGDLGSNHRVLIDETVFSDVNICKKKKQEKKWKILSDSDCSFDEESSNTQLTLTRGEDEVEQSSQSHFSLMKENDLYDAEDSEDKLATEHGEGHSPQTYFVPLKESDVYDAEGSEDEVTPKHISKPEVTSLSERKSKVSLLHVEETSSNYTVNPFSWSTRQPLVSQS
jgi:hypothetical protein